jgi:ectoine hydroxylase-related dioxygenase (phytanoyl-CoA dioxygenase family)
MLSTAEMATYHDKGLIIPGEFRLPDETVNRLRDAVDRVVALNPDTPSDHLINVHMDRAPPFDLRGDSVFAELVANPDILNMVEQLIGPDIILWSTHLFCKPAATGREVPWHQDGYYWPIRPLATCTAWVAIDDTGLDNGALRYIPGSHKMGTFEHRTDMDPRLSLHQVVDDPKFDPRAEKYVEMRAGQLSLHDVHILHGSAANTSGRRRAGLAIRYMPATSVLRRDLDMAKTSRLDWSTLPLSLMRGENTNGANDLVVGHPR